MAVNLTQIVIWPCSRPDDINMAKSRLSKKESKARLKQLKCDWRERKYTTYTALANAYNMDMSTVRKLVKDEKLFEKEPPKGIYRTLILKNKKYYVYDDGRVWSCFLNDFLEQKEDTGYLKCSLGKIHRLVLKTFDRLPRKGEECRHLDGNPFNNHISNLKWGTTKDNCYDKLKHGTFPRGENQPNTILTDNLVLKIYTCWKKHEERYTRTNARTIHHFCKKLSIYLQNKYSITINSGIIYNILTGVTWTHITYIKEPIKYKTNRDYIEKIVRYAHRKFKHSNLGPKAFSQNLAFYLSKKGFKIKVRTIRDALIGETWKSIYDEFY